MMRYLLDTNAVSDLIRNPHGLLAKRIDQVGESQVCTSIIVAAELRYRATKRASQKLTSNLEAVLNVLEILPFEAPADETYGVLRVKLERWGTLVGANDLLIAAQALTLGYTVVTDKEKEFRRIDELAVENWLHPDG